MKEFEVFAFLIIMIATIHNWVISKKTYFNIVLAEDMTLSVDALSSKC
jgi:hypothetical protein